MKKKQLALILIALGLALALLSVLGDTLGVGSEESKFGWKQVMGLVAGGALAATGAFLWFGRRDEEAEAPGADGPSGPGEQSR